MSDMRQELFYEQKNGYDLISLEERVEAVLERNGLFYAKSETWIPSEKLYEVLYETEV